MTGGATDTQLRNFEEIYTYQLKLADKKADILRLLQEKEVLTDELRTAIQEAIKLSQLDDMYRPYKEKKNTRATKAIAKGLKPLADILLACELSQQEFFVKAKTFVNDTWDPKTSVISLEEAIQWAQDIIAEIVADSAELRQEILVSQTHCVPLVTKATKHFDEKGVYGIYKEYTKSLSTVPSYAYLAIARAEKEKQIRVSLAFQLVKSMKQATAIFVPPHASDVQELLEQAIHDGIKRLLHPSLERHLRAEKKAQSDREAIDIFGKNVEELLLSAPVKNKVIMWFDPAYRTWCKIAVIDATGAYLASTVIYPTDPQNNIKASEQTLLWLIKKYDISLICIGNGTASRESEQFVATMIQTHKLTTKYLVVSEAGASVYSASSLAHEEYPELDVTIRGAINIAQRVQDPLATYVKIDPKSLWVGQYQHDVDQKLLKEKLDHHIEDAVNRVGVDVNTASRPLLQHIAGLSVKTAQQVVLYRQKHGPFTKRSQIKKVKGLGPKAFEQCAGFLRIRALVWWSLSNPLDETWIHPESYDVVEKLLQYLDQKKWTSKKICLPLHLAISSSQLEAFAKEHEVGIETLSDIVAELAHPWLDPREAFDETGFKSDVLSIEDVTKGMMLRGIVRNITDFGAFVDIGLKNDGLLHKSQFGKYVSNVFDELSIGQQIEVNVLEVDLERKRVSLSKKKQQWDIKYREQKKRPRVSDKNSTESVTDHKGCSGTIVWK